MADQPGVWLHGEVKPPPFSATARIEAGVLRRRFQRGEALSLPKSRLLPILGARCHELRIVDVAATWRIVYRVDADAVVVAEVFSKKTRATLKTVLAACRRRFRAYDAAAGEEDG